MKRWLAALVPLSLLSLFGYISVSHSAGAVPSCDLPQGSSVEDVQNKTTKDERVYHVGCGGLF